MHAWLLAQHLPHSLQHLPNHLHVLLCLEIHPKLMVLDEVLNYLHHHSEGGHQVPNLVDKAGKRQQHEVL